MTGRLRIGQHGIVGNLSTVALVGSNGSIDFLCWPKLDGSSIFACLLDSKRGGSYELALDVPHVVASQVFLPDTNILSTTWRAPQASAEVIDFMTIGDDGAPDGPRLIRLIRALRGSGRADSYVRSARSATNQIRATALPTWILATAFCTFVRSCRTACLSCRLRAFSQENSG